MDKLLALLSLFREGNEVADPKLWKTRQNNANIFVPVLAALVAVLRLFGVDVPLDNDSLALLSGGLLVLVNLVITNISSKRVGLPGVAPAASVAGDGASTNPGEASRDYSRGG